MRLLHMKEDGKLEFTKDFIRPKDIPPYAILSHTWGEQEVVFDDLKSPISVGNVDAKGEGWNKIQFCARQAKCDNLEYFWVDTCCIDKANNTELSEAINSMFRWYQNASRCYVFLSDVEGKSSGCDDRLSSTWKTAFKASRWFTRGWTLQELLAPRSVEFFCRDRTRLGDKESLKQTIYEVTEIPIEALSGRDLSKFDVATRLSWAQYRQTTRDEDGAYCLLGIFGCHLPLIYGEGREKALKRLKREIMGASEDTAMASVDNTSIRDQDQEERLGEMCSWLSAPDPSTNYHKAHKQRQADTGVWLLQSENLRRWKEAAASRLWLYGIPGCGKTILSSTIIEHLQQQCHGDARKVVVYFYFDFNDSQKQDPELMLRSLFWQLLQRLNMIPKGVTALYSSCGERRPPPLHKLLQEASQLMQRFTHVYIVLDALDECTQRLELMEMLETIAGWQIDVVHLLMTSRKERDIESSLTTYIGDDDIVGLQSDIVDGDIVRYVQQRLRHDKSLVKWNKDALVREEIEVALMRGARGMFRWVVCQIDALAKCRNLATLRKSLATLPQTLDQTYDRILTAIREDDSAYAMRILQWLTFSARPLTLNEVAEVVAIDVAREPAFHRDEVLTDSLDVLDICSGLVSIVEVDEHYDYSARVRDFGFSRDSEDFHIVTLAHYSVQEYLVSDRIKQGPAKQYSMQGVECHTAITKGTIAYLGQFQQPIPRDVFENYALAEYCARFWIDHFRKTEDEKENLGRLVMDLFSVENTLFLTWNQLYDPEDRWRPDLNRSLDSIPTPLYYGALLGLPMITKTLLGQGADVSAQGGKYGHALLAAAACGHKDVVELLINVDNDFNARAEELRGALQIASKGGHEAVVKLLIEAGADVNTPVGFKWDLFRGPWGDYYRNALQAAIQGAHGTIVRMLLEGGASVGVNSGTESAVHYATDTFGCTSSLVKILQQYGAALDKIDVNNMTPLLYCTKREYTVIARQLIDAGASVDLKVRRKAVPSGASGFRYMLADTGPPDSEFGSTGGLTALHFAALNGSVLMTKFLLKHGADPNTLSEERQTPLHLALSSKLVGKIKHDDWNSCRNQAKWRYDISQYETDKTSVYLKAARSRERTVNALLADPRISVTLEGYRGASALHYVQYGRPGSVDLVRQLLYRGADASCVNSSQQTPLHLASQAGDCASANVLLSMGANVASVDKSGLNALHYAARSGDLETIITISKTNKARVLKLLESKDKCGRNALHHILSKKHVRRSEASQWLLDQGVNGSVLDSIGLSPLATYINGPMFDIDSKICRSLFKIKGNASFIYRHGQTLGHLCATKPGLSVRVLEALDEYGVDLAKKDFDGRTVLHRAAMCGGVDEDVLGFLLFTIGIQASDEDKHGRIALQYAIEEHAKGYKYSRSGNKRWETTREVLLKHHTNHKNEYHSSFTQLLPGLLEQRPLETTKRERKSSPILFISYPHIPFPGVR